MFPNWISDDRRALFLFLLIASLGIILGCSDDDNDIPVAPVATPRYFVLEVENSIYPANNNEISVRFGMELGAELPSVTVNDHDFKLFDLENGIIEGWLSIPLAESVSYTIIADGQTVTGRVGVLPLVAPVSCNGITLDPWENTVLPDSDDYIFTWSNVGAGVYKGYYNSYDDNNYSHGPFATTATSWSLPEQVGRPSLFEIIAISDPGPYPGSKPNETSNDIVQGFVYSQSYSLFYLDQVWKRTQGGVERGTDGSQMRELLGVQAR